MYVCLYVCRYEGMQACMYGCMDAMYVSVCMCVSNG